MLSIHGNHSVDKYWCGGAAYCMHESIKKLGYSHTYFLIHPIVYNYRLHTEGEVSQWICSTECCRHELNKSGTDIAHLTIIMFTATHTIPYPVLLWRLNRQVNVKTLQYTDIPSYCRVHSF